MGKRIDPIKDHIAAEVRASLKMFDARGVLGDGKYKVSTTEVSALETQIRVATPDQGVRYFTVKVQEHY